MTNDEIRDTEEPESEGISHIIEEEHEEPDPPLWTDPPENPEQDESQSTSSDE